MKHHPGGHRMLPPAVGTFENPRSRRQLISPPPGAPDADEPVGPTQLRQGGDARRPIPITIHECDKSGHHGPLPPPQDRRRIHAQREHIKNINPPCFNRRGKLIKPSHTSTTCNLIIGVAPVLAMSWSRHTRKTSLTRLSIAQIASNGNPKSQETQPFFWLFLRNRLPPTAAIGQAHQ
jgi:hypothetical protein